MNNNEATIKGADRIIKLLRNVFITVSSMISDHILFFCSKFYLPIMHIFGTYFEVLTLLISCNFDSRQLIIFCCSMINIGKNASEEKFLPSELPQSEYTFFLYSLNTL